jgi:hypothetical protein
VKIVPCLVWRKGEPTSKDGRYERAYDPAIGRTDCAHRVMWGRYFGPIPAGKDIDHKCDVTLCQQLDHLSPHGKPATRGGGISVARDRLRSVLTRGGSR